MRPLNFYPTFLVLFICSICGVSRGQIGTGWVEVYPKKTIQIRGAGGFETANGVEQFSVTNALRTGDQRAEQRVWNDYSSGTHQFEGYLKVTRLDGTFINLKQTFKSKEGPWFLCTIDPAANGTLRDHSRGTILATNVLGRSVRLNTIHDTTANCLYVYVDGTLMETRIGEAGATYNDKYGAYRA